jgi:uncharacterized membrane protein SpoIIM required for sporulation
MTRRRRLLMFAPLAIVGFTVFIAIGGAVVRLLWNWLLPPILGLPAITFWQALGLLALSRILFGGFGMRGYGPRSRLRGRWEHMTPEERERFRNGMRARWGFGPSTTEPGGQ